MASLAHRQKNAERRRTVFSALLNGAFQETSPAPSWSSTKENRGGSPEWRAAGDLDAPSGNAKLKRLKHAPEIDAWREIAKSLKLRRPWGKTLYFFSEYHFRASSAGGPLPSARQDAVVH
jgi:hypothetical protein